MASIDFATDLGVRRRAVLALGKLGDEWAFGVLLKLAAEDAHALQESAAEALGHLGRSPRADEAFKLLERLDRRTSGLAASARVGLRWFNTRAAWQVVRARAADPSCPFREVAIDLLGHDDDPATRELLLKLLATLPVRSGDLSHGFALIGARRIFGPDSLEPDHAALQNEEAKGIADLDRILSRVRDRGEPARIFAILPKCPPPVLEALRSGLIERPDLPIAEAKAAIGSPDAPTVALAAHILGRAGKMAADAAPAVELALARWRAAWEELRARYGPGARAMVEAYRPRRAVFISFRDDLKDELTPPCLRTLVWTAGRLGIADGVLESVASARVDDIEYRPIRREAVLALAAKAATPDSLKALEGAEAGDLETRAIAAQGLARLDPARAGAIAGRLLGDSVGFRRLVLGGKLAPDEVVRSAARQVHHQGVVLAGLIDRGEVETLTSVLGDRALPEAARLGALEGPGAMALEPAEAVLRRVGADPAEDDEIRKAAWRSLRRSKRAREKKAKARPGRAKAEVKP